MARTQHAPQPEPKSWLRGLPKAELHLHLEGSITAATLLELSQCLFVRRIHLAQRQAFHVRKQAARPVLDVQFA